MKWHYTDGWNLDDFSTSVTISDDAELSAGQKTPFVQVASSAASKTLLLGLGEGDCMILMNSGNNAITVKNVEGDTGSSVAKGDIVLIVASETADATSVEVLNGSGGGGGGDTNLMIVNAVESGDVLGLDKTYAEIISHLQDGGAIYISNNFDGNASSLIFLRAFQSADEYLIQTTSGYVSYEDGEAVVFEPIVFSCSDPSEYPVVSE